MQAAGLVVFSHFSSLYRQPRGNYGESDPYITHNATWLLSDINGGNSSDYMRLLLEPQKGFTLLF